MLLLPMKVVVLFFVPQLPCGHLRPRWIHDGKSGYWFFLPVLWPSMSSFRQVSTSGPPLVCRGGHHSQFLQAVVMWWSLRSSSSLFAAECLASAILPCSFKALRLCNAYYRRCANSVSKITCQRGWFGQQASWKVLCRIMQINYGSSITFENNGKNTLCRLFLKFFFIPSFL